MDAEHRTGNEVLDAMLAAFDRQHVQHAKASTEQSIRVAGLDPDDFDLVFARLGEIADLVTATDESRDNNLFLIGLFTGMELERQRHHDAQVG